MLREFLRQKDAMAQVRARATTELLEERGEFEQTQRRLEDELALRQSELSHCARSCRLRCRTEQRWNRTCGQLRRRRRTRAVNVSAGHTAGDAKATCDAAAERRDEWSRRVRRWSSSCKPQRRKWRPHSKSERRICRRQGALSDRASSAVTAASE